MYHAAPGALRMLGTYLLNEDTPAEWVYCTPSTDETTEVPCETYRAPAMGPRRTSPPWDCARKPWFHQQEGGSPRLSRRKVLPWTPASHSYVCIILPSAQRAGSLEPHPSNYRKGDFQAQRASGLPVLPFQGSEEA